MQTAESFRGKSIFTAVFTEQCYNLLHDGGTCGIVVPSGIYSDLGTKQLRKMLLEQTQKSRGLFGFENRRKRSLKMWTSRFKFVVLTFGKRRADGAIPKRRVHAS